MTSRPIVRPIAFAPAPDPRMETSVSTVVRWPAAPILYGLSLHHSKISTSSPSWAGSEQRPQIADDILARDELIFLSNCEDDCDFT